MSRIAFYLTVSLAVVWVGSYALMMYLWFKLGLAWPFDVLASLYLFILAIEIGHGYLYLVRRGFERWDAR